MREVINAHFYAINSNTHFLNYLTQLYIIVTTDHKLSSLSSEAIPIFRSRLSAYSLSFMALHFVILIL